MIIDRTTEGILIRDQKGKLFRIRTVLSPYCFNRLYNLTRVRSIERETIYLFFGQPVTSSGYDIFRSYRREHPNARYMIGIAVFETDSIPAGWAKSLNMMDEVWTISHFNAGTFMKAGVIPEKIRVVPIGHGIELFKYHPASCGTIRLDNASGLNMLTILQWSKHKGYDVLFRAYGEEFTSRDDVTLHVRAYPSSPDVPFSHDIVMETFFSCCPDRRTAPRLNLIREKVPDEDMPALFNSCDVYILPSRGEGWGIPYMEAMALEKITVGTRWGGNLDFMNDANSFLVEIDGLMEVREGDRNFPSVFWGQRMARPSISHTRQVLRHIYEHRESLGPLRKRARRDIQNHWTSWHTTMMAVRRLKEIVGELEENERRFMDVRAVSWRGSKTDLTTAGGDAGTRPSRVLWDGEFLGCSSLAKVNREICNVLVDRPDRGGGLRSVEISSRGMLSRQGVHGSLGKLHEHLRGGEGSHDVCVRHLWPPDFKRPDCLHFIMMLPWEFGSMPRDWFGPMQRTVDRIWVYSRKIREDYIEDGIDPSKISVIPLGVNFDVFRAGDGEEAVESTGGGEYRFLFVGGTLWRKGIDLLLKAYLLTFSRNEDVVLVIKDMGTGSFYRDRNWQSRIRELMDDPGNPRIEYLCEDLTEEEVAGLYRSGDCLVHPYRGEGFGLPVAEAMAMNLPVIVTRGGACDDFCAPDVVYPIESDTKEIRYEEPTVRPASILEPSVGHLSELMRDVFENRETARSRGIRAGAHIRQWNWERTAEIIEKEIDGLTRKGDDEHESAETKPAIVV